METRDSADRRDGVLFLCTGNSARSILAEAILNDRGGDRFRAYSAGSHPTGKVNPGAQAELTRRGLDAAGFRSKSWDEFSSPDAPDFRFVFTVCDNAAGEACPVWPGRPVSAHWGIPDPAAVTSPPDAVAEAFAEAYDRMASRIDRFLALQVAAMSEAELASALAQIGVADR